MNTLHRKSGSILLLAVGWIAILAVVAVGAIFAMQQRHRQAFQTASWQEALLAAESGIDIAVAELRRGLQDPSSAWSGWHPVNGTNTGVGPTGGAVYFTSSVLLRSGEGGQRSWARVEVDAPAFLKDSRGEQWYRVRSRGFSEVPGGRVVTGEKLDNHLRKLDLHTDRATGSAVSFPQATRMIEAIVKPVGAFRVALMGDKRIDMNNHNIVVDSYDSRDPSKSTNGWYDPAKRQESGHIATNGTIIDAGNAHIYGDASTNGGTVLNPSNVTGEIRDDFYMELFPVTRPVMVPTAGTPSSVNSTTTIVGSPGTPTQVVLSTISLSGPKTLTFAGAPDGSDTFVQVLVNGDVSLSGQAGIVVGPGVHVRMFIVGDADITGNGVLNPNNPLNFQVYGVDRLPLSNGSPAPLGNIKIAGNGGFRGSVYAPNYEVEMVGGGNTDSIFGAFVGNNVRMTGVQSVHYDEALADGGLISDYKVISWFEDVR
jgi:hypothetical protein